MTRTNRVLPDGQIVAHTARGMFMGNRGCLHDAGGALGRARWRHRAWISCLLSFRGWRRPLMQLGRYTELFFLDEAVAIAAGHRPCALCRPAEFRAFAAAWGNSGLPGSRAPEIDRVLHGSRVGGTGRLATHCAPADTLPDGGFAQIGGQAMLVQRDGWRRFRPDGYGPPQACPAGEVRVLTCLPMLAVLRAGYRPVLHPTVLVPLAPPAEPPGASGSFGK